MKPALLIIDLQEIYYRNNPSMQQEMLDAITEINAMAKNFRQKKLPIIVIYHNSEKEGVIPGTDGYEMHPNLIIENSDIRITKTHSSAFIGTPLEKKLNELGIDTLILSGIAAEYCVLATYHGADHYNFRPIYFAPGVASVNGITQTILSIVENMTTLPILKMLEQFE